MSYSFSLTAATKIAALALVAVKFDEVALPHQPIHARDKAAAIANADAMIGLLRDPAEDEEVSVQMSGSLGWSHQPGEFDPAAVPLTATNASCSAWITKRPTDQA